MQTLKRAFFMSCVLAAGALCLAPSLRAADDPPVEKPKEEKAPKRQWQQLRPERLISDDTFLYITTPDFQKARTQFERTALRGLLGEEDIKTPILATFAKLRETYVKGDNIRNESEIRRRGDEVDLLTKIAPLLDGQVAIAVDAEVEPNGRLPRFLVIASMPTEDRQRELEAMLDKFRYSQTTDPRFRDINDRVGAYDVYRMENNDLGLKEAWAFVENLFIYGQGNKIVEDAIERYSVKNGAGTLSMHGGYQNVFKEVGRDERGESLLYMQVDARGLIKLFAPDTMLKPMIDAISTGLEATRPHMAMGIQLGDGTSNAAIREKMFFKSTKDNVPVKATDPCKCVSARMAQNDSLFYSAAQYNLAESYRNAISKKPTNAEWFKALTGAQNDAEIVSKLEMFKGEASVFFSYVPQPTLKFENPQDFFEAFQFVIALELESDLNEVGFKDLMARIEKRTKQVYLPAPTRDVVIRYQKGAAPREEKGPNPLGIFAPEGEAHDPEIARFFVSYARVDLESEGAQPKKFLLMSDSLNALRKAVQQSKSTRASLSDDARFKTLLKSFRETHFSVTYFDMVKGIDIYNTFLPHLGRTGQVSRDTLNQMPSANSLRPYMFPAGLSASYTTDPEGVIVETYSPTGNLPLVGLIGLTAWPLIVDQQSEIISLQVDEKFKQILLGLHLYAADYDRYPTQLSDLHPTYVKDFASFESPFKRGLVKTAADIDNPDLTNLVYVPNRSLQDLGSEVILYEKEPTRLTKTSDGSQLYHHVITLDAKKSWLTRPALELRLSGRIDFLTKLADKSVKPAAPKK